MNTDCLPHQVKSQRPVANPNAGFLVKLLALDKALKNAPAGSDVAVSSLKSAIAAANSAYDSVAKAAKQAKAQAAGIAEGLMKQGLPDIREKKIVALIAYLQRLGTDIKKGAPAVGATP